MHTIAAPDGPEIREIARRVAEATGGFTGGPPDKFGHVGFKTFEALKSAGLTPESRVLDIGCGTLRLGYWLVRYLDADRYFGLDPVKIYIAAGLTHVIGDTLAAEKRPRFDNNKAFDFSVFGEKFDFAVACSIFSHISPGGMRQVMESFRDNSTDEGVLLASYVPLGKKIDQDVVDVRGSGREWTWRRYRPAYVRDMAREVGLQCDDWTKFGMQQWLRLSRKPL